MLIANQINKCDGKDGIRILRNKFGSNWTNKAEEEKRNGKSAVEKQLKSIRIILIPLCAKLKII